MASRLMALVLAAALLSGGTGFAHHSQAAQYDTSKQVSIEGTLVQFQLRNPHSFVHIEAPDASGTMQRWSIEWGGAGQLTGQGVTRTTLSPVTSSSSPPTLTPAERPQLHMVTLKRTADGFGWGARRARSSIDENGGLRGRARRAASAAGDTHGLHAQRGQGAAAATAKERPPSILRGRGCRYQRNGRCACDPAQGDYTRLRSPPPRAGRRRLGPRPRRGGRRACKAYGAPAITRVPGRMRISWQDDNR